MFIYFECVWNCKVTPKCDCASATLLREREREFERMAYALLNPPMQILNLGVIKICVAPAADFRCDWAVSAMRPNSYPVSVTNCSVTSVPCVSVGSLLHAITVALLSLRGGPLRHAALRSFLYSPLQSSFPAPCSASARRATGCPAILVLLLSQVECFLNYADLLYVSVW